MKTLKLICLLIICCIVLFVIGCNEHCDHCGSGSSPKETYALVNNTNVVLYYRTYYNDIASSFDTILSPNDTLLLYSEEFIAPIYRIEQYMSFYGSVVVQDDGYAYLSYDGTIILFNNETVLFYESKYAGDGIVNIVSDKKDKKNHYYYWVIDSTYITDNSYNMSWEDFEERYLKNE